MVAILVSVEQFVTAAGVVGPAATAAAQLAARAEAALEVVMVPRLRKRPADLETPAAVRRAVCPRVKPAAEAEEAQGAPVRTQGEETVPRPPAVMEEHTLLVEPPWNMRVEDLAGRAVELRIVRMLQEIPETVAEAETVAMIQSVVRVATAVQEL